MDGLRRAMGWIGRLGLVALLAGCSAWHSLPPPDFAARRAESPRVLRVAFDQYGAIYPDAGEGGLALPPPEKGKAETFSLAGYYAGASKAYDPAAIRSRIAGQITQALQDAGTRRLVVLIKGYNASYAATDAGFALLRNRIEALSPDPGRVYLQVYWDAYNRGPKKTGLASFFGRAMESSNLAGLCGLRPLLALLPVGTDISMLTHSRGAAVALGVAANPALSDRKVAQARCTPEPPPGHLGHVALVAFAPAVGEGVIVQQGKVPPSILAVFDRIYVGFNHFDKSTSKTFMGIRFGSGAFGDTRLASNEAFLTLVETQAAGAVQHETFSQKRHAIGAYLAVQPQSACLLWAGWLIDKRPDGCATTR